MGGYLLNITDYGKRKAILTKATRRTAIKTISSRFLTLITRDGLLNDFITDQFLKKSVDTSYFAFSLLIQN